MSSLKFALSALSVSLLSGLATAGLSSENVGAANNAGTRTIDMNGNLIAQARGAATTIFSNLQAGSTADRAFSSTDMTAVFGDHLTTAGTGTVDSFGFTLYNSSSSAGALATAQVQIQFYRAADGTSLGGFNVNTGTLNLAAGFYTTLNVTDLSALNIVLDTTDIIVTQTILSRTGTASRLGVVSTTPTSVGSSVDQLYIDASDVGGGAAGFYNITSGGVPVAFHTGYEVNVIPAPGALAMAGLGGLLAARRRR